MRRKVRFKAAIAGKEERTVNGEEANVPGIITGYVLPLAGAAAVAAFIGYGLIGANLGFGVRLKGIDWGLYHGISVLAGALLSVFVSAFVIDALAPSFGSEKNLTKIFFGPEIPKKHLKL